jgi:uncharacterized RDD family membrane protein YckC
MRAAELQIERLDFPEDDAPANQQLDPRAALKQQVAERLAAHRSRRSRSSTPKLIPIVEPKPARPSAHTGARPRANRIATAVAERYAQTQSYRDFLAAEAARAIEEANAAAEIAARNAVAVTVAQQQLLAELANWSEPKPADDQPVVHPAPVESRDYSLADEETQMSPETPQPLAAAPTATPAPGRTVQHPIAGLTVRLYEDVGIRHPQGAPATRVHGPAEGTAPDEEESFLLDDEIAFRQTPVFPAPAGPPVPIPANLIEFPRQLVAPRKSRPRLAEGPLREEAAAAQTVAQLRIFEVEPEQISTVPGVGVETVVPEWAPIHLDAIEPDASLAPVQEIQPELQALLPLQAASLNLRAMAAAFDGCILGLAFLAAAAVFGYCVGVLPAWPIAAATAAGTLLVLFILYYMLFFTFADATPGMRYARIGLCTFSDENPTRAQMRRRTWAVLLSACPLGIGFLWALLDDEGLGWHDRISRMYQRAY